MWKMIEGGIRMVVWVGLVCFVLGANLGFLVAGLMRMARLFVDGLPDRSTHTVLPQSFLKQNRGIVCT